MAKYCPYKDGPALYLDCRECDEKLCENEPEPQIDEEDEKKGDNENAT